jgi:hypothetical protein
MYMGASPKSSPLGTVQYGRKATPVLLMRRAAGFSVGTLHLVEDVLDGHQSIPPMSAGVLDTLYWLGTNSLSMRKHALLIFL